MTNEKKDRANKNILMINEIKKTTFFKAKERKMIKCISPSLVSYKR